LKKVRNERKILFEKHSEKLTLKNYFISLLRQDWKGVLHYLVYLSSYSSSSTAAAVAAAISVLHSTISEHKAGSCNHLNSYSGSTRLEFRKSYQLSCLSVRGSRQSLHANVKK
jgi:hypothetical protein